MLIREDVGSITALNPARVLILHDGDEDHWNKGYEIVISLFCFPMIFLEEDYGIGLGTN